MKMCQTCGGIGSVPDPKRPGSTRRCKDCGGTGLARAVAPAADADTETKGARDAAPRKEK